jgi:hypothetical protein
MPKRARNALTLLSAVVCVLSLGFMVRSFFRLDHAGMSISRLDAYITTHNGLLTLAGGQHVALHPVGPYYKSMESAWAPGFRGPLWKDLITLRLDWGREDGDTVLVLPLWLLPLLTAIPLVRWWRARRRNVGAGFAVLPVT